MGRALLLVCVVVAAAAWCCCSPAAADDKLAKVAEICKGTPYPDLCTSTAGKQASRYPTVDALTVLKMQVDAFDKRTAAARAHLAKAVKKATPGAKTALDLCDSLYGDVEDNLGAARRAIGFKDATTIRAMMSMAVQDLQGCDEQFRKVGEKNPMERFDQSLGKMAEICRWISNMI